MTQSNETNPPGLAEELANTKRLVKAAQQSPEALQDELDRLFPGSRREEAPPAAPEKPEK